MRGGVSVANLDLGTSDNLGQHCGRVWRRDQRQWDYKSFEFHGCNNSAATGGGVRGNGTSVNLGNTIIAKNTATTTDPDFSGSFTSQEGYNLIGDTTGTTITGTTTGNQLNVDPKLDSLQDNGGPTQTHALLPGSPAIDTGNSNGAIADQRGSLRPSDRPDVSNAAGSDGSDIGAFEVASAPDAVTKPATNVTSSTATLNGSVNAQGLATTYYLSTASTITTSRLLSGMLEHLATRCLLAKTSLTSSPTVFTTFASLPAVRAV